ncbi:iron chelate uptake ABC transporter family permease subunit [Agitococcus lubricus]|uniref:High-affinity zinc uptake system membrane protein ZnuB n=1 Tax=Agitococcus lubricus TaxID=1077255 RepID=A0A2T5J437_9GAMM|nr:iron chelate uptake ABC transporter family permease subunit [Agitococcus lubricus]PTQ91387.1 zinc transport system permease protein [Agitococcus lubricus]
MWEILWPAWLGGVLVAMTAAPLGCLLVWRRLAYFGDSLSHATLLGVALSLWWQIPVWGGILSVCLLLALALASLLAGRHLPSDAILSLLSATTLSAGLIAISQLPTARVDLLAYLFGDLLSLTEADLPLLAGILLVVMAVMAYFWRALVLVAVDEELAAVEGVAVLRLRLLLLVLLVLVITVAMKVVGSLLITALLVIPTLVARPLTQHPTQMALVAAMTGSVAVSVGLAGSFYGDTPVGPSIVVVAALLFVGVQLQQKLKRN